MRNAAIRVLPLILLLLLVTPANARSKPTMHPGEYVEFGISFAHKDEPIAIGAMFENRNGMFTLVGFKPDGDGYAVRGRIPKNQAPGTYTMREIVVDYGSHQDILTSPVDFPKYKVRVEPNP